MIEARDAKRKAIQDEVDRNFEAFGKLLPNIIGTNQDKYALMKGGKILGYYSSAEDARVAATTFIEDEIYSIQHVTNISINLGFFNHAVVGIPVQS